MRERAKCTPEHERALKSTNVHRIQRAYSCVMLDSLFCRGAPRISPSPPSSAGRLPRADVPREDAAVAPLPDACIAPPIGAATDFSIHGEGTGLRCMRPGERVRLGANDAVVRAWADEA